MGVRRFPQPPPLITLLLQSIHLRSGGSRDCLCLPVSCWFLLHFPYCVCTSIFTLTLFFLHRPPWLYCSSFQKQFPQYRLHSWAGNCRTRKPVGHFLVPGIWSPVLLSSSHSGNPAFKNVPALPLISKDNELEVTLSTIRAICITGKKQNTLSRMVKKTGPH